jgi:excisionase family DNA binding protein
MSTTVLERQPVFAPPADQPTLREIEALLDRKTAVPALVGVGEEPLRLPATVVQLLATLVHELACGNAVTIVPVQAELTTNHAAELLNVSRPYLVRLLDAGKIPFHRVGTHRRIKAADLLVYKEQRLAEQRTILGELARESQALGLYE